VNRLPGIGVELAAAIRTVNAAYLALPEEERPDVVEWGEVEDQVDAACASGDRESALAAIERWRDEQLAALREGVGE
jgi:hypothetical protein